MLHDPEEFSLEHRHGYTGGGIYGHYNLTEGSLLEPMLIQKFNDDSLDYQDKSLFYYGARMLWRSNGFKIDSTYIQQQGDITKNDGSDQKVDAYGFNVDLNYRFNPQWLIGSTFSLATGDDKSTAQNERFDGVYGASDKFYGRMNLMAWSNLHDYELLSNYRPNRDWEFQLEYHQFYADQINDKWRSYKTGLNADSKHYGDEIDLITQYKFSRNLNFQLGLGVFKSGAAIQQAVENNQSYLSDDIAYSGFFQVVYKFSGPI